MNTITNKLFLLLLDRIINGTKTSQILVNVLIKVKVFARIIISCTVVNKQLTTELRQSNLFVCTVHCTLYNLTSSIQCIITFGLKKMPQRGHTDQSYFTHLSLVTRHSSLVTCHSSLISFHSILAVTHHSSLVTCHLSLVTHNSLVTRHS